MGPPDPEETARIVARDLSDVARELASLNGMARSLKGGEYTTLRFRMEAAHAAVEATLIEARRPLRAFRGGGWGDLRNPHLISLSYSRADRRYQYTTWTVL
jgi:hypothetical protein